MKLINLLIHKKINQSINISIEKDHIIFNDLLAILYLNQWKYVDLNEFDSFISKYTFPERKEFKRKDREAVRDYFPKPQILLTKTGQENDIRVALALYQKKTLTGKTLLHLRSINKFEQMEIRYFIDFKTAPINDPKMQKRNFYEFCQSSDIFFDYNLSDETATKSARLRIITISVDDFIILLYAFDKNLALGQEELDLLINSFKVTPNSLNLNEPTK